MNEQIKTVKYEFQGSTVFITLIHDFFYHDKRYTE